MNSRMWSDNSPYILSVGACTPLGTTALKAAAAVRCGISAYAEHPYMVDRYGEPMVVAMADFLEDTMPLEQRIEQLAIQAAVDAVQPLVAAGPSREPLLVIFAFSATNLPDEQARVKLGKRIGQHLNQLGITVRQYGCAESNAIGVEAIRLASQYILNQRGESCLVIGADSHLAPERLEAIDYSGRLHSVNNSWGFAPGEGAGAVLISSGRHLNSLRRVPLAEISAVATADETKLLGTKTVCIGEGLSQAFRKVLSEQDKVHHTYCDLNGETYRAEEFGFAVCRTGDGFRDAASFTAAADCWGDVGAASAPLQIALATSAWSRDYAKGPISLCWCSSASSPLRGAIRLRNDWATTERRAR